VRYNDNIRIIQLFEIYCTVTYILKDEHETLAFAAKLAKIIPPKALIFLNGPLGAGKTTLVRGILRASGHQGSTKSPTYTLVEPYQLNDRTFYHFDLYRLGDPEELEYIGIRDYLDDIAVCLVEWPEKGQGFMPDADLVINLNYEGEARSITLEKSDAPWCRQLMQTSSFK
jgi:tRNA threonylcarbamoyladenosine biosynthesis protein TsaE